MTSYSRREVLQLGGLVGGYALSRGGLLGPAEALARGLGVAPGANSIPGQAGLFSATEMLSRPTDRAATLSLVPATEIEAYVEMGPTAGAYVRQTAPVRLAGRQAAQLLIDGLVPDSVTHYRLRYRQPGAMEFAAGPAHRFHTQRAAGAAFTFAVQADSHLGTVKHCDPALYTRTLENIARDAPDFLVDLGDTFRATKLKEATGEAITKLYLNQRQYLGLVAHSAPLFLVNGNHEMEWGWLLDDTPDSVPALSAVARRAYFPQPEPDGFYTGNQEPLPNIGLPQDYYAWHWGDALFVVIDPYWHTTDDPGGAGLDKVTGEDSAKDPWNWTLGESQYRWFRQTLASSPAHYKFVFHHHVLGACRGGVEWADFYEWGGRERNGADTFAAHRPGWESPIHPLMVKHGVTIFFQGHDHLFARQQRDGIVYQTVPMAGDPTYSAYNSDAYDSGDILPNTGHLRVSVTPERVAVDYIRSFLPSDETEGHANGELAFSYTVPGGGLPPTPPATATAGATPFATTTPPGTQTAPPTARRLYLPFLSTKES